MPEPLDPHAKRALLDRVESILDREVRGSLLADGGGVEVVDLDPDHILQVRLTGACVGCPSSSITLTMAIERSVKAEVPEVRFVEAVL
jgi:Fe-S cluster biogenesis protein NfuA